MNQARRGRAATTLAATALLAACGGASGIGAGSNRILVALNVPTSADPYVAQIIGRGAQLAVAEANQKGGVSIAGRRYRLELRTYDDAGRPQQAAANVGAAIHDGAVAIVEDGIGATVSAPAGDAAGVPEIVIDNGDTGLMDPQSRPSLFRLGVANDAAASVLSMYLAGKTKSVAVLHDDSASGRDGGDQVKEALATGGATANPVIEVSAASPTIDTQIQQIAGSGAGAIVVWGSDTFTGRAVAAIRAAGVTTALFTGPAGESPAVRTVAGATATEGLRMVASRMTSESDASSFGQFEHRLAAAHLGPTDAGVKNAHGQEIRQPNDRDFFSYDAVNLIVAALKKTGSARPGSALIKAVASVHVPSANGDTRGFNPQNHEGVSDDDTYIAVIHDMQFQPVKDEPLSASLPDEDQILSDFH
ncbi:MAG: amino acid ABC transporter substrate-binding protein [Chloroflexi bacterium]|nr:MAG: amino acid ABC transporter substrate-binding protein [Chloroflexota bacterium]